MSNFLQEITKINFEQKPGKAIEKLLYEQCLAEINEKINRITTLLDKEQLDSVESKGDIRQQEENIRRPNVKEIIKQKEILENQKLELTNKFNELNRSVAATSSDDEEIIKIHSPEFIQYFASHFRDLKHLAFTLYDAPQEIKEIQTDLLLEMLSKLPPDDKEKQISSLSIAHARDMFIPILDLYNTAQNSESHQEKNRATEYKELFQIILFELIKKTRENFSLENNEFVAEKENQNKNNKIDNQQDFLTKLDAIIPEVKDSDILDNFSEYRSVSGKSVEGFIKLQAPGNNKIDIPEQQRRKKLERGNKSNISSQKNDINSEIEINLQLKY